MKLVRWARPAREAGDHRCGGQDPRSLGRGARHRRRRPQPGRPRQAVEAEAREAAAGEGQAALRRLRRPGAELLRGRPELRGPCGRDRRGDPEGAILFNKATSCIIGPNDDVMLPKGSKKTDWEVELAVVIGSRASYVTEKEAMEAVAGFCICNDVSEREYQIERGASDEGQGLPHLRPDRALARHQGRDQGRAETRHVARSQWRARAERLDEDDDLHRQEDRLLHVDLHGAPAGRRHHHRHAAGRSSA